MEPHRRRAAAPGRARPGSPLHEAAAAGDVDAVRARLATGVAVDRVDADRCSPLHVAVTAGALDTAGVLIEAGADVEFRGRRELLTPLHMAALAWRRSPDGAMIGLLRGYGADPTARDAHGLTAVEIGRHHAGLPPDLADLLR